jgi:hypothetical protein
MRRTRHTAALKCHIMELVDSDVHFPQVLTGSPEQFSLNGVWVTRRYRKTLNLG